MRLRRTAVPKAFLTLQPNRLTSRPLGRRKTANSRTIWRLPCRYTASYSARLRRRKDLGKVKGGVLDARKTVASFPASFSENFSSASALHARAEAVFLVTTAHVRLKRTFRQRSISSEIVSGFRPTNWRSSVRPTKRRRLAPTNQDSQSALLAASPHALQSAAALSETDSVCDACGRVKKRSTA